VRSSTIPAEPTSAGHRFRRDRKLTSRLLVHGDEIGVARRALTDAAIGTERWVGKIARMAELPFGRGDDKSGAAGFAGSFDGRFA
jgi:hypothetical protein